MGLKQDLNVSDVGFYKLMLLCSIGCLCIVASFFVPVIAYIGLAFFLIVALFTRGINRIYILLFTLPFYNVFRCSKEQTTFCAYLMAFIVAMISIELVIQIIKKHRTINIKNLVIFAALMFFFVLPIGTFSIANSLRLELGIVLIFLCLEFKDKLCFKKIVFALFFGFTFACILNPIRYVNPHLSEFLTPFYSYIGNLYRFCGLAFDPNYFAVEVILLIICFTQLYMQNSINYIFFPIMLFLFSVGILTVSKSFLIVLIIYLVLSIIYCVVRNKSDTKAKKLLISFGILSLCLVLIFSQFILVIIKRFTSMSAVDVVSNDSDSSTINHITTGRSDLWVMYLKHWITGGLLTILFGFGNNQPYLITNQGTQAVHNLYIEVLYHFGIAGFALVFGLIGYLIIRYCIKYKVNYFSFVLLACMLIFFFSINSFISYRPSYIVIILLFSFLYNLKGSQEENCIIKQIEEHGGNNEIINHNTSL